MAEFHLKNAVPERFLGNVRPKCLDHVLVLGEAHRRRMLHEYVRSCIHAWPRQCLAQRFPDAEDGAARAASGVVQAAPVLAGLYHAYARAARCRTGSLLGQDRP